MMNWDFSNILIREQDGTHTQLFKVQTYSYESSSVAKQMFAKSGNVVQYPITCLYRVAQKSKPLSRVIIESY